MAPIERARANLGLPVVGRLEIEVGRSPRLVAVEQVPDAGQDGQRVGSLGVRPLLRHEPAQAGQLRAADVLPLAELEERCPRPLGIELLPRRPHQGDLGGALDDARPARVLEREA